MNMSLARRGDPDAIWQFHVIHGTPTPDCRQGHNQTQNGGEPVGMRFLHRSWLCSVPPKSAFEKWVAWATRPFRSATRRPERARLSPAEGCPYSLPMRSPFRPASRRTAQASGLCYPKRNFQTRITHHASRITHHASRLNPSTLHASTLHASTLHASRFQRGNAAQNLTQTIIDTRRRRSYFPPAKKRAFWPRICIPGFFFSQGPAQLWPILFSSAPHGATKAKARSSTC